MMCNEKVPRVEEVIAKHAIDVEGYEGQLDMLAERIHRMQYDKTAEFYQHSAAELRKQAESDWIKGRHQLAAALDAAADIAEYQQKQFAGIWALCEPHMRKE